MRGLNSIEIRALVKELKELCGARVQKIFMPERDEVVFSMYHKEKKSMLLDIVVGEACFVSMYKKRSPMMPSHFCMFLRKYLNNSFLRSVSQPDFERIIEFRFSKEKEYILILELFSKGNLIICDSDYNILIPLRSVSFDFRSIRPRHKYKLPPSKGYNIARLDFDSFVRGVARSEKTDIVRCIASEFGLGGCYAEEILARAGVPKNLFVTKISKEQLFSVFSELQKIVKDVETLRISPKAIISGEDIIDFVPFDIAAYESCEMREFSTLSETLDFVFSGWYTEKKKMKKRRVFLEKREKLEKIAKRQEEQIKLLEQKAKEASEVGKTILENVVIIDSVISTIVGARRQGVSWVRIKEILSEEKDRGVAEALFVKEVLEDDGLIVIDILSGVVIDFGLGARGNAQNFFSEAKRARSKLEGAGRALERTRRKISKLLEKEEEFTLSEEEVLKNMSSKNSAWFSHFSYFHTRNGFLLVCGRDATQNEVLIKKHLDVSDLVFHADIFGSPFGVLKNGREAGEEDREEAAEFVAAHSRAFREARAVDAYYVGPDQVSKRSPSGEYIVRGAFMISGKKNYFHSITPRIFVGIKAEGDSFALVSSPRKRVGWVFFMELVPGDEKPSDVAKHFVSLVSRKIKDMKTPQGMVDDVMRLLPSGKFREVRKK